MKNKFNDFKEKVKELYSKFKTAWADPRKKAGIKLLSYLIFFFILLLIAGISNNLSKFNSSNRTRTTTTTKAVDKYNDKQNNLLTNKYNINYVININNNEYKINGTIENNVLNGYLEMPEGIKKIVIKDNIYEIINEQEIILESEINPNLVNISYIINLIKQNSAIIATQEEIKKYNYNIEDLGLNIIVSATEENISQIDIVETTNTYTLKFDK